jgi:hypothetical protein
MIKNIFKLLYVLIKIKHFLNDFKGVFFLIIWYIQMNLIYIFKY